MANRASAIAALLVLLGAVVVPPVGLMAQTAVTNQVTNIPITGEEVEGAATFTGTLDLVRFAVQGGEIVAIGRLTGTLLDAAGNTIGTVTNRLITLPVSFDQATCEILTLQLGPLELNLLGLNVFLDEVFLQITAEPGPGNLLGNLLCAIAGLLDPPGPLQQIVNLLNQILGILRGLGL